MDIPPSHKQAGRLYGQEFAKDPARVYQELRREYGQVAPILLEGSVPAWLVLSYRDLHHVTSNPRIFGVDSRTWNILDQVPPDWPLANTVAWSPSIMRAEGTAHRRRSDAMSDVLDDTDRTELAAICERTADQFIDEFIGDGQADLVRQYTIRYPVTVLARLMGLDETEIPGLSRDIEFIPTHGPEALEAFLHSAGVIAAHVREQRDQPRAGLTARMIGHPATLTDDEVTTDLHFAVGIGHTCTADWISNSLRLMLVDDQFSLTLQGGRSSADQALNEVLWKETPMQNMIGRWATQDVELGGRRISKGDLLVLGAAAANTDPLVQPESGNHMSVNRAHMSFGHGDHGCPYPAPDLAEIMAKAAIEVLLDRIPDVELAVPESELRWKESVWVRGLHSLPVHFAPVAAGTRR